MNPYALNPAVPILSFLKEEDRLVIAGLRALVQESICFAVMNPFVPLKQPRLSPAVNPELLIGDLIDAVQTHVPLSSKLDRGTVIVDQLTHMLYSIGLFNVNRSRIIRSSLKSGCSDSTLERVLAEFIGQQASELRQRTVGRLAEALAERASIERKGFPVNQQMTGEVYLCFFAPGDVEVHPKAIGATAMPAYGATPTQVIRLMHPGCSEWFYYRETFDLEQYDPYQELCMSQLTTLELSHVVAELSDAGVVHLDSLGVRFDGIRDEMRKLLARVSNVSRQVRTRHTDRLKKATSV